MTLGGVAAARVQLVIWYTKPANIKSSPASGEVTGGAERSPSRASRDRTSVPSKRACPHPPPATYPSGWGAPRSSDNLSYASATRTAAFSRACRALAISHAGRGKSPAPKIEHLLGMTLDDIAEIMSWPIAQLDPFRPSVRMQVMRIVFAIGVKALLDGKLRGAARERDHERVLGEMARNLRDSDKG